MRWLFAFVFVAMPASAQEYSTPEDYAAVEQAVSSRLQSCMDRGQATATCADNLYAYCTEIAPDADKTAGLSICGGVTSNVFNRALNVVWADLRAEFDDDQFGRLLISQPAWLAFRAAETNFAAQLYPGGSRGAYSGWIRYDGLSSKRLAYLHDILARN